MSEYSVSLIPPMVVEPMWSQLEPQMARAASHTAGRFDTHDIFEFVLNGSGQLWGAFHKDRIVGVTVTRTIQYPRKKCLDVVFLGGEDWDGWREAMYDIVERWARDSGCEAIESFGRSGFARVFKERGYEPLWQVFEFPVTAGVGEYHG